MYPQRRITKALPPSGPDGPSELTSVLSRAVHAHGPRQAASSATPERYVK
jgi:hypothetical protein